MDPESTHSAEGLDTAVGTMTPSSVATTRALVAPSLIDSIKVGDAAPREHVALRRWTFLFASALGAGGTGFASLVIARQLVDHTVFACTAGAVACSTAPPYLLLALTAGAV